MAKKAMIDKELKRIIFAILKMYVNNFSINWNYEVILMLFNK